MNEDDTVQNEENVDTDEEDCEEYFLQSTPGPYDIREKIRAANDELFEEYEAYNVTRELKVTFREELVDYEPDFSSDDGYVNSPDILSVISDNENEEINHDDESLLPTNDTEYILENNLQKKIDNYEQNIEHDNFENKYSTVRESYDTETINVIEEEEVIDECEEEIEEKCMIEEIEEIEDEIEDDNSEEQFVEVVEIINDDDEDDISSSSEFNSVNSSLNLRTREEIEDITQSQKKSLLNVEKINCRLHCLEKKELDFLNGKPKKIDEILKGPVLKFRQRFCCTNQPIKPKLPVYNGFISEYGMTKTQLERRQRRKEKIVQKKKEKTVKISEEKKQKDLYNEEIFCAWLKSLKNRNQCEAGNKENTIKTKQRPKTAPHCNLSLAINKPKIKRPSTSPGCSYKIIFQ